MPFSDQADVFGTRSIQGVFVLYVSQGKRCFSFPSKDNQGKAIDNISIKKRTSIPFFLSRVRFIGERESKRGPLLPPNTEGKMMITGVSLNLGCRIAEKVPFPPFSKRESNAATYSTALVIPSLFSPPRKIHRVLSV